MGNEGGGRWIKNCWGRDDFLCLSGITKSERGGDD